ncbi:unnamed protein product [Phytophthora fragariaefolia]|uniref:Unnamed protein product n=1 Tax=Phytophthora fragariaefolia TaxID=1490495 RepID=A0A9W7CYH6_9STRA|nr:unnamed protein product [Phytophthora fragariaefolia]
MGRLDVTLSSGGGPSLDDGEIDLVEFEDESEDKTEKDEDYNPHQDLDDGVDDEDEDPDEALDDGVLCVAQRTTRRRRLSRWSAEAPTSKKLKAKSPVKTKVKAGSSDRSKLGSGSSKKPKSKFGGSRCRNASTATALVIKAPQHLDTEGYRVIETPGLGIMYVLQCPDEARRPHYTRSVPNTRFSRRRPEPSRSRHPKGALRRGGVEGFPGDASLDEVVRYPAYGIFLPSPGGLGARSDPGVGGLDRLHGGERGGTLARDSLDRAGPRLGIQVHPGD